mgnify:CR=1 FL=1
MPAAQTAPARQSHSGQSLTVWPRPARACRVAAGTRFSSVCFADASRAAGARFSVNAATGAVTTAVALDYESQQFFGFVRIGRARHCHIGQCRIEQITTHIFKIYVNSAVDLCEFFANILGFIIDSNVDFERFQ